MSEMFPMRVIARVHSDFSTKFGVPRQSGLVDALEATVVFEPPYRNADALRGLEDFSHLWLVWVFDQAVRDTWSPTVRPPRLGGNARMGVFATRSPFRPNPIALSAVALAGIDHSPDLGPVLRIRGADLMDGTPILDIKPYIPYADCIPQARGGFAAVPAGAELTVHIPPELAEIFPAERIPGPGISTTRSGYTALPSPAMRSASGWRGTPSRWWTSGRRTQPLDGWKRTPLRMEGRAFFQSFFFLRTRVRPIYRGLTQKMYTMAAASSTAVAAGRHPLYHPASTTAAWKAQYMGTPPAAAPASPPVRSSPAPPPEAGPRDR